MTPGRCIAIMARNPQVGLPNGVTKKLASQSTFTPIFKSRDLEVWGTAGMSSISLGERGIVAGQLFTGLHPAVQVERISDEQGEVIIGSQGAALLENFWGAYVAFLRRPEKGSIHVLRDPSPGRPMYRRDAGPCIVCATDVDDLMLLGLDRPGVSMDYLAAHLQHTGFRYRRTALDGVEELVPGESFWLQDGRLRREELWSPWRFAAKAVQFNEAALAAAMLRGAIDGVVAAWASLFDHVLLGVSGGLDSSIVAAALKAGPTRLSLLNFLSMEGSAGDERVFVEALSRGLGEEVEIAREAMTYIDIFRSDAAHLPRPVGRAFSQSGSHHMRATAQRVGADVIFSGGGGDNVFCYLQSSAPVADRILMGGSPAAVLATARDIARISGAGIAQIARAALGRMRRPNPAWLWKPNRLFLDDAWHSSAFDTRDHPWLRYENGRLPGKLEHIGILLVIYNFLEGFGYERRWPVIYPLLSQPLIELCLRIPSWMWCAGGVNRAVARQAYQDRLPAVTVQRQSKGSCDRLGIEVIETHHRAIRDFLCGGVLAQAGIIRADAVGEAIHGMASYQDLAWSRILTLIDVEAWVRARG